MLVVSAAVPAQTQAINSAAGVSAQLGNKVVVLPTPENYEEVASQWETIKTVFAAMVPREGDLLAAYLPVSDCELIRKGQKPLMPSWLMINIYREARTHVSDRAEFGRIVGYARQDTEGILDPNKKDMKELFARADTFLTNLYSKDVKLDLSKPKILGEFDHRPNVYSNLLLMKLNVQMDGKQVEQPPMLGTMSMVLVKQRIITVLAYKRLESKDDAEVLTKLTTKWINEILAAN